MKEFCVINNEKQSAPQCIARSGNFEEIKTRKESMDQQEPSQLFDLEDEDNMAQVDLLEENDYFIKLFAFVTDQVDSQVEIG